MTLNIDSIKSLANILEQRTFDKKEFNKFIKTKGIKEFLDHQRSIDSSINIKSIEEELRKIVLDKNYMDKYEFYLIRENITQLYKDIEYIRQNGKQIIDQALKEVYKIVPEYMTVKSNIYFYIGGIDGGFTVNRKKVFINYVRYMGLGEELIKILSHEIYHSRNIPIKNRIIFLLKMVLKANPLIYETIGKAIEEGVASLVQHGGNLKTDDPIGTLTMRNLTLVKKEFDLLNHILLDIKNNKYNRKKASELNIYVIGYHIVSKIYNTEGVLILDDWTVDLKYEAIIKKYIEICNTDKTPTGFNDEILEWIIS